MKIRDIFNSAKPGSLPEQWLYLPIEGEWTLDNDGLFLDCDNEEKNEKAVPLIAKIGRAENWQIR